MEAKEFANYVLTDWDDAMDRFFAKVQRAMDRHAMTTQEVEAALQLGYGYELAEQWADWMEEN